MKIKFFVTSCLLTLSACTVAPPENSDNICEIFREKDAWYDATKESFEQWGVPIHVQMAIMYQESRFVADAQPPRPWLLGIIPWFRSSSAYGYSQAQDGTWDEYLNNGGKWGADRDDFTDSCDFIGWYCSISQQRLGISKWDTRNLYLAYHEGHGGYRQKTYRRKQWLVNTANKVARKASQYHGQLSSCKEEFESKSWFFW